MVFALKQQCKKIETLIDNKKKNSRKNDFHNLIYQIVDAGESNNYNFLVLFMRNLNIV